MWRPIKDCSIIEIFNNDIRFNTFLIISTGSAKEFLRYYSNNNYNEFINARHHHGLNTRSQFV